jgi:60 kDa SS-A/Ro ribonucleoprotein
MVNKALFQTTRGQFTPEATAQNLAGGKAYEMSKEHQLAQYAVTGCMTSTFYASATSQLDQVLELCKDLDSKYVAQVAIYAREKGFMKDIPALLCAILASRGAEEFKTVFPRVINTGKMLKNFVQIIRSGVTGRKSFGTRIKKAIQNWLNEVPEFRLLEAYIGNDPSLADVIKMVHPKPLGYEREAFFAWVIGKDYDDEVFPLSECPENRIPITNLPPITKSYVDYKKNKTLPVPEVPFQMLTSLDMGAKEWAQVALNSGWHMVRMNLNTFARHGVYQEAGLTEAIAKKLVDKEAIAKAKVFPYQLMTAYLNANEELPFEIKEALQDALEISLHNVPKFDNPAVVCVDVSGSMGSPVTGQRGTATSKMRCIDVAGLMGAAIFKQNPKSGVVAFAEDVVRTNLNPRDSVMTTARQLASFHGGGTNCAAPLARMIQSNIRCDLVIYVSDNESWMGQGGLTLHRSTNMMYLWNQYKVNNPNAKLVCIDITPNATSQAIERKDILNIGGFSDNVFTMIDLFVNDKMDPNHWVGEIKKIEV